MESFQENYCIRCSQRLKTWEELSAEEKLLAEKLPASAIFKPEERRRHLFCTRCWNEVDEPKSGIC